MVFFLIRPLSVWSVVLHPKSPAPMGGQRRLPSGGTAFGPRRHSGRVRTAEQRPEGGAKNYLNQTLSAQRARRAVAFIRLAWEFPAPGAQCNEAMVTKITREHPWASASLGCWRGHPGRL